MPKKYIPIPKDQQKKRGPKLITDETIQEPTPEVITEPAPEVITEPTPEPIKEPTPEPTPISEPVKPSVISTDVPTDLDDIINDYSSSGAPAGEGQTSADHLGALHGAAPAPVQSTAPKISLVRGYMILLVLDFVLPMGITFLLSKTSNPKFKNIKAKDIKLTDDEFDDLEPVADEVAKDVQLNLSPMTQLFLGMAIIYGGKLLTLDK